MMRKSIFVMGAIFLFGLIGCDSGTSTPACSSCTELTGSWKLVDTVYGTATITDIFNFSATGSFSWVEYDLSGSTPDTSRSNGSWHTSGNQLFTTNASGGGTAAWMYSISGSTLRLIDSGNGFSDTGYYTRQ